MGRADICVEVSMMSSHLALPRKGHMEQVLRMFAYLKGHTNPEKFLIQTRSNLIGLIFRGRIGTTQSTPQVTVS